MPPEPSSSPRFHALVPCAGAGARAGSAVAKQYVEIAGRPLVAHTLAALCGVRRLSGILVVVAPDDAGFAQRPGLPVDPRIAVARCGGATRAATVRAGLEALVGSGAGPGDWVLVHDAARCLVQAAWIDALIDACIDDPVGGLLAVPVADTLKREDGGRVAATVPRDRLWQAQTPQMFRFGPLLQALDRAGAAVTDEAGAIEATGATPRLVSGSPENIKVTHPGDFAIAAALLKARRA
jgi:2-C-methyl-D-erythritol 4-phosphate cytidylyltransferase